MALWLKPGGIDSDVAVSTRVRLARNLVGVPCPHKTRGTSRAKYIIDAAKEAFLKNGSDFELIRMSELSPAGRAALVEQHVISKELSGAENGAAIVSPDKAVSVMINEEDHYRLQYMKSGCDPEGAFTACRELEAMLGKKVRYAFDQQLGYLTACPTNVGTGLRVSVMLHLKGLALSNTISAVLSPLAHLGVTARGLYGEGTAAQGEMYQISNQITLGVKEEDIVKNMKAVAGGIIEKERDVRRILYKNNKLNLDDAVKRSYALLKYAEKMSSKEAIEHFSMLNLGIALDILSPCTHEELYNLNMEIMPAMLAEAGETAAERDKARADIIRKVLK